MCIETGLTTLKVSHYNEDKHLEKVEAHKNNRNFNINIGPVESYGEEFSI